VLLSAIAALFGLMTAAPAAAKSTAASVKKIEPKRVSAGGGQHVTITGKNLQGATSVTFGSTPAASFAIISPRTIDAVTPAQPTGSVSVTVATPQGTGSRSIQFMPLVTGVSPDIGSPLGGTKVTITGFGFAQGATSFKFGGNQARAVTDCPSETTCEAVTPVHKLETVEVRATVNGIKEREPGAMFTYSLRPLVSSLIPKEGPASGGTSIVITGENLSGATAVNFGSTSAASFTVESETSISAVSPPGAGTVDVTVAGEHGTSETRFGDQFSYVP
jgi:hypothetical protein